MNARKITILTLAGMALPGLGLMIGYGIGRGGRDREAGVAEVSGTMKPVLPGRASTVAERGEIREFVPGRPFAKGKAEAWLLGLRGKGRNASIRALNTLDSDAAKEVAAMIIAICKSWEEQDDGPGKLWKSDADIALLGTGMYATLYILAVQDPDSAVASVTNLGEAGWDGWHRYAVMVWSEIARHAPERLEALLASVDHPSLLVGSVEGSVMGLLESDVEAGAALMMNYPGEEFESLRGYVINSLLKSDPRRALALATTLAGDGQESWHLCKAIDGWLKDDETAARQWVEEHEGPGRDLARARLLYHDAVRDPGAAVAEFNALRQEGVPDEVLADAVSAIVEALGKTNMEAARAWMETLPEVPMDLFYPARSLRDEAIFELAREWSEQDPLAASEWIATLPPGKQRDAGARHLVDAIRKRDPVSALEWARNVSDERRRRDMIAAVLKEWREQDPEAAEAAALGLSEEDRPSEDVDF